MHLDCNWTAKFRSQWTGHKEPSTISATVAGPVGGHLQAGTEDAPVLNHLASLRRLHDSGATYPDLLYLHAITHVTVFTAIYQVYYHQLFAC